MSFDIKYVKNSWLASGSAGYDLLAAEYKVIKPQSTEPVCVHLEMEIPSGYYGLIHPRSSLARYHFIDIGGGVIDSDFRGELTVIMFNHLNKPYEVKVNDRIAQIIFHRYEIPKFVECSELSKTDRDKEGFGSTGV